MPGGRGVFPTLSVRENLQVSTWLLDLEQAERATADALEQFPRLRERIDQMAGNLSGGEQQMLSLAMAFVMAPEVLVIDELSLGLAPVVVGELVGFVRSMNQAGTTVLIVEQSVNLALTLADRAYFMEKGQVRFTGPTEDLLERGDLLRAVMLRGDRDEPASAEPRPSGGAGAATNGHVAPDRSFEVAGDDGTAVAGRRVPSQASNPGPLDEGEDGPPAPVLSLTDVRKRFGGVLAVGGATLAVHPGEVLGIIGPNGAGKTTTFDLISGFLAPDEGRITFQGSDITGWSPDRRARGGLGRLFQDSLLFPSMSVTENLAVAFERHFPIHDDLASMLGLPEVRRAEDDVAWSVHDLLELFDLGLVRDLLAGELSTGTRRVVDLAMAVAHQPTLLLLDEPSSGLAQRETEAMAPMLRRIQRETGAAMVIIEHDMGLITEVSDRMLALEVGMVIAEGTPDEVVSDPRVVSSYLGADQDAIERSGVRSHSTANGKEAATTPGGSGGSRRPTHERRAPRARKEPLTAAGQRRPQQGA